MRTPHLRSSRQSTSHCCQKSRALFPAPKIPRSTALSWIRRGPSNVVSLDEVGQTEAHTEAHFRERIAKLERRISMLTGGLRLVLVMLRLSGFRLGLDRVPDAESKRRILGAIERA